MHNRILFNIVLCLICGVFFFPLEMHHPINETVQYWEEQRQKKATVDISGTVVEVSQTEYSLKVIVKDIYDIPYRVMLELQNEDILITPYDKIRCSGTVMGQSIQYNPADMDYETYLKSEAILSRIKVDINDIDVIQKTPIFEKIRNKIDEQIDYVFKTNSGIIKSLLLGDKSDLNEDIQNSYFNLGVGHILVISGFHIGLIYFICTKLNIFLGMFFLRIATIIFGEKVAISIATFLFGYYSRLISTLIFCWTYCFIIGLSTSNLRACIFITLSIVAKCIWQEDDYWNNIAIAAGIIIIYNPYSLFGVGFQLSFGAMIGIGLYQFVEEYCSAKDIKLRQHTSSRFCINNLYSSMLLSLCITIILAPILAYHFYTISYISIFINAFIIEIFTVIIIGSLIILGTSFLALNLSQNLVQELNLILDTINLVLSHISTLLDPLIIRRPTTFEIILYYMCISSICIGLSVQISKHNIAKKLFERYKVAVIKSLVIILSSQLIFGFIGIDALHFSSYFIKPEAVITQLYVGQGDGTVIQHANKIIVIDGGIGSSYSKLKKHINSKGKKAIDIAIISHTDYDHVGAIIEWIKNNNEIKLLIVPKLNDEDEIDKQLIDLCTIYEIEKKEITVPTDIEIGDMALDIIAPSNITSDKNNNSLVFNLSYRDFNMLYTGDISKEVEENLDLQDIDILKVAHHGSKTSTSEKLLELSKPEYAIISCGKNNIYNHPHTQVLDDLEKYNVNVLRTDLDGAITIELYENQVKLKKYIKTEE
ncbi:DNA internalization-related competence protein ComEC/Rec2 [Candidatus Epulonipiscium fishelsonii]|uniref:DNA internalization-related competence protein ComEC/Rec2 n=1 Tax=Candidatus Epulonipiscium fishelsonii TaxID=77094 RepID=A0ACC8X7Y6_9FIRM|nr:DNA internalization-related competence protein ComEC/Rec2 [Epulopiscium sp. SCG-B11WGA-EpuloA1]ONI41314.1 DNA internalization-related competence protein ComEC/Rec2 [Epulopiscium sp. SCG-B05WGA-EpuloA1]